MKHHLVQIVPVAIKARFCVRESFSGGRKKSLTPARTRTHFITGALSVASSVSIAQSTNSQEERAIYHGWMAKEGGNGD